MHVDVAIVGAGPAGCWAARLLAERGVSVALIDGSHPREKPCGGGVTGRALRMVADAVDASTLAAVAIDAATFEHGGRTARVGIARDPRDQTARLSVVSRRAFDGQLLAAARRAGARFVPLRATAIDRTGAGWRVATREAEIASVWLLGADGPTSFVRRTVARPFARADLSIAAGYYVHGVTSHEIGIAFEDSPPGYLWSFPREDHLAVGVCAQADTASSASLLETAAGWIERRIPARAASLERYSWPIPSLGLAAIEHQRCAGDRWLLLGDAAGMVDAITREGIYFALRSAESAARSLLAGGDVARDYDRDIQATIFAELTRAARLKSRFFQPRVTALMLSALQRSHAIRTVLADLVAGQQSYHGLRRRLLATVEIGLMFDYLRHTRA